MGEKCGCKAMGKYEGLGGTVLTHFDDMRFCPLHSTALAVRKASLKLNDYLWQHPRTPELNTLVRELIVALTATSEGVPHV